MPTTSTATPAKVETVTIKHLAETLSESHELPKKQVVAMLEDMVTTVTKHLKRGARIRIGGLGILQVRKRPAEGIRLDADGQSGLGHEIVRQQGWARQSAGPQFCRRGKSSSPG